MLQQITAEVQLRLAAQVNGAVSFDRTRLVNITFSRTGKSAFSVSVRAHREKVPDRSLYELLCKSHEIPC